MEEEHREGMEDGGWRGGGVRKEKIGGGGDESDSEGGNC